MEVTETDPVPSTSAAASAKTKKDTLPWMKCVAGCRIDENIEVISLRCLHSICSEACVRKVKCQAQENGEPENLFCGLCGMHIEEEDLEHKIVPSQVFLPKPGLTGPTMMCEHCVLEQPAIAYCPDCPACLCAQCKKMHPLTRITQHHRVQDSLDGKKFRQVEDKKDKKCEFHLEHFKIFYCFTCKDKLCLKCKESHEGHAVVNMINAREKLKATAESASELHLKCSQASKDVKKKVEDMKSSWNSIITNINDEFTILLISLLGRQDKIKFEAKRKFLKKLADLQAASNSVSKVETHSATVMAVINEVIHNRDELSSAIFLNEYKPVIQEMLNIKNKFDREYNDLVQKGREFKVNNDGRHELLKGLGEFGDIEYQLTPEEKAPKATPKPAASASSAPPKPQPVSKLGAYGGVLPPLPKLPDGIEGDPFIFNSPANIAAIHALCKGGPVTKFTLMKLGLLPMLGVAKKSTGSPQGPQSSRAVNALLMNARKSNLPSGSNDNGTAEIVVLDELGNIMDMISNGVQSVAPPVQKDVGVEVAGTSASTSKASAAETSTQSTTTITTIPPAVPTATAKVSTALAPASDNGTAKTVEEVSTAASSSKEATIPPKKPSGDSVPSSLSTMTSTQEAAKNPEQLPATTVAADGISPETGIDKDSPNGAATDSSSPAKGGEAIQQELGLGKRTRRPKCFPDHISPDDTLKVYKPPKNTGSGIKRIGGAGGTPVSSIKMPRLVPEGKLIDPLEIKLEKINETENNDMSKEVVVNPPIPGSSEKQQERAVGAPSTEVSPVGQPKRGRGRPRKIKKLDLDSFESAPQSTVEEPADHIEYPIQGHAKMKITNYDDSEDYCQICFDGGEETIVCCDSCPKVFHLTCHVPPLKAVPPEDESFYCFNCTTKEMIDERVSILPEREGSENQELVEGNEGIFVYACKFLMECHLISEIPTVRWIFPRLYHHVVGKDTVPFHLKYIRERLTFGKPTPFPNLRSFILAFRQMFIQAFIYYENYDIAKDHLSVLHTCFEKFLELLTEYYPEFRKEFDDVVSSAEFFKTMK